MCSPSLREWKIVAAVSCALCEHANDVPGEFWACITVAVSAAVTWVWCCSVVIADFLVACVRCCTASPYG
jgi:hypothetical protein